MKVATFGLILTALAAFSLLGCDTANTPAESDTPTATHPHEGHDHGDASAADMEKIDAALAKLSPDDSALAHKQRICPVSEELLGTMGTPQKIMVEGQAVFICCDACKGKVMQDPDKYLAKIK